MRDEDLAKMIAKAEKERTEGPDNKAPREEVAEKLTKKQAQKLQERRGLLLRPKEEDKYIYPDEDQKLSDDTEYAISCLIRFIKRNRSLLHVNLANTGLTESALWPFGAALRRTKSLRSIHLSGNQITPRLVDYLVQRIHANGVVKENVIPLNEMPSHLRVKNQSLLTRDNSGAELHDSQPNFSRDKSPTRTQSQSTILHLDESKPDLRGSLTKLDRNQKLEDLEFDAKLREAVQLQFIQRQKKLEQAYEEADATSSVLLISRKLGHKDDIPGSGRWKVFTERKIGENDCYICDRQIYSIVFWSEPIGSIHLKMFEKDDVQFLIDHVKKINGANDIEIDTK